MSRSIQWNVTAYMISAALLASLIFSFNLSMNAWNERSSDINFQQWQSKKQLAPVFSVGPVLPSMPKSTFQPVTVISHSSSSISPAASSASAARSSSVSPSVSPSATLKTSPSASSTPTMTSNTAAPTAPSIHSVPPISASTAAQPAAQPVAPATRTYQVTSYYLNVRAMPSADADILDSLKQGTLIQVKQSTDNGWLALADGGYVHGRYAEPAAGDKAESQPAAPSATAVASPVAKSQSKAVPAVQAKSGARVKTASLSSDVSTGGNPNKPTSKIKSDSGLTRDHIAALLKGTKLQGIGLEDVILGVEEKYGINAFFVIAVMKLESGNGKSTLSRTKNNLFGLNATSSNPRRKAFSFKSKGDSIRKFAQLINDNYVERGFTTVEKIGSKYCPANGLWAGHVRTIMRSDFGKLA